MDGKTGSAYLTACAALKSEVGALLFFPLASFNLWQYFDTEQPEVPEDYEEKAVMIATAEQGRRRVLFPPQRRNP